MAIPYLKKAFQSEIARLNKASFTWLAGRLLHLYKNNAIPGAINPRNYEQKRLLGVGDIFAFHYDPKLKNELPYYDRFPLTIILNTYSDGWLGLNLHYLPPDIRTTFLNKLVDLANVDPTDNRARIQISYELLKSSQYYGAYVPCIKRYLVGHVRSQMMRIFPHEWQLVIHMPFEAFSKASKQQVWNESRRKI